MDKTKRQKRFEQKLRNVSKWLKRKHDQVKKAGERFTREDEKQAHIEANHGKRCSCHMCMNPRHNLFRKSRLTVQEVKADEKFDSEIQEYPD